MSMTPEETSKILRDMLPGPIVPPVHPGSQKQEAIRVALAALRGPTREMVERMRGVWTKDNTVQVLTPGGQKYHYRCSKCGYLTRLYNQNFCPSCGSPLTDEAVDMVMERMEAMQDGSTTD